MEGQNYGCKAFLRKTPIHSDFSPLEPEECMETIITSNKTRKLETHPVHQLKPNEITTKAKAKTKEMII